MLIQVAFRHDTTDAKVKEFIETELGRIEQKYDPISAEVVIDHEGHTGHIKTAEFHVKTRGELLHVKESSTEIHKSIDACIKALEIQLKKAKEKHLRPEGVKGQMGTSLE